VKKKLPELGHGLDGSGIGDVLSLQGDSTMIRSTLTQQDRLEAAMSELQTGLEVMQKLKKLRGSLYPVTVTSPTVGRILDDIDTVLKSVSCWVEEAAEDGKVMSRIGGN